MVYRAYTHVMMIQLCIRVRSRVSLAERRRGPVRHPELASQSKGVARESSRVWSMYRLPVLSTECAPYVYAPFYRSSRILQIA